jgi:O-antigen/teichoic acid export membrane protein
VCFATVLLEPVVRDLLHIGTQDRFAPALVAVLLASLAFWQGLSGLLLGMQRFSRYAMVSVIDAAVRAAAIVPLVIQFGIAGALAGYAVGSAAANALAVRALGGLTWRSGTGRIDGYQLARVSGDWILLTLLVAGLQNLDLVLLRSYAAADQVGWYAAAATVANLTFTLASPLYAPLYPRLVSRVREGKPTQVLLFGTLVPLIVFGTAGILITAWVGGPIARLLFGDQFIPSGALLPVLLVKTTALLALLVVGQYAIALRHSQAVVACSIPSILTLGSIAVLHLPAEQVALVTGLGAASAAVAAGLLLLQANATRPTA